MSDFDHAGRNREAALDRQEKHRRTQRDISVRRCCPDCGAALLQEEVRMHWKIPITILRCTDCGRQCYDTPIGCC